MKKIACLILTGIFTGISASEAISAGIGVGFTAEAADFTSKDVDALQYTYEIYPLLEPFNEYFYVKTENPHPESFRFSDKDSPYSETSKYLYFCKYKCLNIHKYMSTYIP